MTSNDEGHVHIHEMESHIEAVETDLEYFRRKRLEPRVLHFLRRGIIGFADLLDADPRGGGDSLVGDDPQRREVAGEAGSAGPIDEARIRAIEDRLDALVHAIAATTLPLNGATVAIEDGRRERGDYDGFFRITPRPLDATDLATRAATLERRLDDDHRLVEAFTRALIACGRTTAEAIRARHEQATSTGYHNGARIVARAWVDPAFKQRLLETGRAAVRELDIPPGKLGRLGVAENTDDVHNIVVCTLCSCYPHDLLGNPPWWYRTDTYKQRIVEDPRPVMAEMFDLEIPEDTRIRVHDSTSDVRWMVLPQRPPGTDHLDEEALAALVTPESLVGAALVPSPDDA